jgi:predicted DNA-binding transcriptional regulator YafY
MNRLDRLTAILTQLQSKKTVRAQEIADRFEISLRTVYRDVRALEEAGVPVIGEAGIGYSLVEGYRLPPVMFTKEEAISFLVAEKLLEHLTDKESSAHFHEAMYKIKAVLRSSEKDTLVNMDPLIAIKPKSGNQIRNGKTRHFQNILTALTEKTVLGVEYQALEKEVVSERVVEPIGIYFAYDKWYLIAWCRLRSAYRTFRVDRIRKTKLSDEKFDSTHPTLLTYLKHVEQSENLTQIVIEADKSILKYIQEEKFNQGFVMEKDLGSSMQMTFMTSSPEGLLRWLLMLADHIKILEPEEAKERVVMLLQEMLTAQTDGLLKSSGIPYH